MKNGRLWLQVIGKPDPNGRTVAVVYKDSLETSHTLNYLMVRAGWAYWYSHYEDGGNELGLKEAEATAYMEGVGVWQEPGLERPWTFKERMRQEVGERERQEKLRQEAEEKARQEKLRREAEEEGRREVEERERPVIALTPERERRLAESRKIQESIVRRRLAGEGARREAEEEQPVIALTPERERRLAESREMQESIARRRLAEERKRR